MFQKIAKKAVERLKNKSKSRKKFLKQSQLRDLIESDYIKDQKDKQFILRKRLANNRDKSKEKIKNYLSSHILEPAKFEQTFKSKRNLNED